MNQSENINELTTAFVKFKSEHPAVSMDEQVDVKNKAGVFIYSYTFASLPGIKKEIEPFLTKNGLAISQFPDDGNKLVTILMHTSGQFISACLDLNEMNTLDKDGIRQNSGPQDYGSILTFARRYAYYAVLGLIGDSSNDKPKGNAPGKQNNNSNTPATNQPSSQGTSELPWLNKTKAKSDVILPEWHEAVKHMTDGGGDIEVLLRKYRINKDNKQELIRHKELYVTHDKLESFTDDVKQKILAATSVKELEGIHAMYPLLQKNKDFIERLSERKIVLAPQRPKEFVQPTLI